MRNTKKAFTLVELIVVITILAILATIAFISLSGYSQDAKNSKVKSDVSTLRSAIETSLTKGDVSVDQLVSTARAVNNVTTNTYSMTYKTSTGASVTGALSTMSYGVGLIDFAALGQNGENFTFNDGTADRGYLTAYASTGSTAYYQVVGEVKNQAGSFEAVVDGSYFSQNGTDANGLVAGSGATGTELQGLKNGNTTVGLY